MTATRGRPRYTAPTLPRIAALYARVSKANQGEEGKASLPTQIDAMRAYAEELGFAVVDEYIYVEKHSGEELYERPEMTCLRSDAKRCAFGLVLCYSVERLARHSGYVQIVLEELERLGIGLDFASERLEDTPEGRMIRSVKAYAGEVENERRKDRIHRALMARVQSGKPIAGARPRYGYKWADIRNADGKLIRERLVEDPDTMPVVLRIWHMADAGMTQRQIAGMLTQEGILTPTGKRLTWDPSTIHQILTDGIYWGEPVALKRRVVPVEKAVRDRYRRRFRDIPRPIEERVALPSTVAPAVISKEMAMRVQERKRQNKELSARRNREPNATLLRGLAYCGVCGYRLTVANANSQLVGPQFRCNTQTRLLNKFEDQCRKSGNTIMAHKLDAIVWAKMIELFEEPGRLAAELDAARTMAHDQHTEADAPARTLKNKIANAEKELAGLRKMAALIDSEREREAYALRINLLARDRDLWVKELAGLEAAAARPRIKEQAILDFQAHVAAEHGNMEGWAFHVMRQLLLLLEARVEVWPVGDVKSGKAEDRAVLQVNLPIAGERRLALSRLLRDEQVDRVMSAVAADGSASAEFNGTNSADHAFARSTMKT